MAYKDILVYLDPTGDAHNRLRLALDMALAHGARLTGVDASAPAALVGPWGDRALHVGPEFEAALKAAGVVGRFVAAGAAASAAGLSHCVDLIIAPRPEGETRAPSRSTTPTTSWPGTIGSRRSGNSPSTTCRSVRQTPQASTRISNCPGPGAGVARSSRTSGAPILCKVIARIASGA